jgi:hypothetical protein
VRKQRGPFEAGRHLQQRLADAAAEIDADEAGGLAVGVDDAPVAVEGEEGVAYALQHGVHALARALQLVQGVVDAQLRVCGEGSRGRRVHDGGGGEWCGDAGWAAMHGEYIIPHGNIERKNAA